MKGKFSEAGEIVREKLEWGELGWISRPAMTRARQIVAIEVTLLPGQGHNFHKHPEQEEVIYVLSGKIEQWLENSRQILTAGDSAFIHADVVHASFTEGAEPARLLAILSPCRGEGGYELVDVSQEAPWNGLR